MLISVPLIAGGTAAHADDFSGTYNGKATTTSIRRAPEGQSGFFCPKTYDYRITVKGTAVTADNRSNGMHAKGTIQPDGSFTTQGLLGRASTTTVSGRIGGKTLTGQYTTVSRDGSRCEGTLSATRH